ncbi:exosome complex component MTR3 [Orussus abietinus]|uniref:exosome complex component MTR3 n=1 Tax=Orussus abietinus TaxID=222816 RepID=UPI0006256C0F|nr:exosome complex component MTR3 [Orussus abietinus]
MPIDQKRINGPEVTIPYEILYDSNINKVETNDKVLENREDGRTLNEHRKMFVKTGIVSQAKGSAYIEMGKTKVVCSVFDPREIPNKTEYSVQGELFCEFKFAPFSCSKRRIHQQDAEEKEYSLIMQRALEPAVCRHEFPNFQIDIYALVLDNDGSSLSAAIMAASLALANASVPMFGLVTAATAAIQGSTILLDPTDKEEAICSISKVISEEPQNHGIIMQAILPQHTQVSEFFAIGSLDLDCIKSVVDTLTAASKEICPVMQQCLVKSVIKCIKTKGHDEMEAVK